MKINLTDAYGNRCIEGVDKKDILDALEEKNPHLKKTDIPRQFTHSCGKIYLDCVQKYFIPEKSYFHLNDASRCLFIQKAFGVAVGENNCNECIKECIKNNLRIKKSTRKISRDYFKK